MNSPTPVPLLRLSLLSLALGLGTALAESPAGATAAAQEEPIDLPKFEVVDSRVLPEPEKWNYVAVPGYDILTTASARNTNRFVREFSRLQQVLAAVWPSIRQSTPEVPVGIILCDKGNQYQAFFPPERLNEVQTRNCMFYQDHESATIVVDFAATQLFTGVIGNEEYKTRSGEVIDAETGEIGPEQGVVRVGVTMADPFVGFRRSYLEYLVENAAQGRLPLWFREGLVQILMSIDYTSKTIEVGRVGDVEGSKDGDFNLALASRGLMAMEDMFLRPPPSTELASRYIWQKQCQAFVHWCLYGERQVHAVQLARFLNTVGNRPPTEQEFKACFGFSYGDVEVLLRNYLTLTKHTYGEYRVRDGETLFVDPPEMELREATQSEVGRIKGEALRLSGQPDKARSFIIAPYVRGERDAELLAVLGLAEHQVGQAGRAKKFFEAAVKEGTRRARVYLLLAELRANEALRTRGGQKLRREELGQVLPLLVRAQDLPPLIPEIFEVAGDAWLASDERPTPEEFTFVLQGTARFPTRLHLVYRTALLAARSGYAREAQALIAHGEKYSPDPRGKALFAKIRADYPGLQQAPLAPTDTNKPSTGSAASPAVGT